MPPLASLLTVVSSWVASRNDIDGLALVGSWARGTAGENSDVDLMLLTSNSEAFRKSSAWLDEMDWSSLGLSVHASRDADYGAAWSRHVALSDGTRVEFTFAHPSWASARPCDPGTRSVIYGGCRVLYDPAGLVQGAVQNAT